MNKKIIFKVLGMHCVSCAANIENVLKKEVGVKEVNVNFASEKLYLEFDESRIGVAKIKEIVFKSGYKVIEENFGEKTNGRGEDEKTKETQRLKKRFISALIFGLPLFYVAMGQMLGLPALKIFEEHGPVIQFILAGAVIISCFNIWVSGFKNLLRLTPNMDSLVFIGSAAAYFYSLAVSIQFFFKTSAEIHLYYESAAFILVFISLGKYLEALTKGKTGGAIKKLIGLQPKKATIIKNGREIKIPALEVKVGDIVKVFPGEKIPADGVVVEGYSGVDEKAITGESIPAEKKEGDRVIGATINKTGVLKFRAVRVGKDTMLAQIIKTVEEAMGSKAPIQLLADKVSFYFVPFVIVVAVATFFVWLLLGQPLSFALTAFVAVLIIACPCALGLATPAAVIVGTGLAAERGILIKSGKALEIAHRLDVVVFDKTGTLTKGEPSVADLIKIDKNTDEKSILRLAASLEKNSEHPLAQAIVNRATEEKIDILKIKNFQALPGRGVAAELEGKKMFLGTRRLMSDNGINPGSAEEKIAILEAQGKTVMLLAMDNKIIGLIAVADILKEYSEETIKILQKMGKKTAIITGDNKKVARTIARQIGVDEVLAEVLPREKSVEIKRLQSEGKIVAMVGDGINDAPALAQADLGVALGSGTDVAMEAGEIVLIKDDLRDVATAIDLSRYTFRKIKQNLFWAFFYNIVGIPLAAGVLYPLTGRLLSPTIAAAAMAFSSVSVIFNALLMKRYKAR